MLRWREEQVCGPGTGVEASGGEGGGGGRRAWPLGDRKVEAVTDLRWEGSDWHEMGMGSARKKEQTREEGRLGLGRRPPIREKRRTDMADRQRASSREGRNQTVLCHCCT